MPCVVTQIPVPADGAPPSRDLLDLVEVERAHHLALFGHDDLVHDADAVATGLRRQERDRRLRLLAREADGRAVGSAHVLMPLKDNQHLGLFFVNWDPGCGVAEGEVYDALWAVVDEELTRAGRTTVQSWATHPAPGDPDDARWLTPGTGTGTGRVAEDDRARWFAGQGFALEQVELYSVLDLADAADVTPAEDTAYGLRTWVGSTPPELRAGMARLYNRMSVDTPAGGIDNGEEQWDDAEVVADDERADALGLTRVTTVALTPDGEPVAYTVIDHAPATPASATQDDTLVHGGHRGRGLGLRVKAANLLALREAAPTVRRVHTWNAAENAHMLAINAALGFREAGGQGGWQLRR